MTNERMQQAGSGRQAWAGIGVAVAAIGVVAWFGAVRPSNAPSAPSEAALEAAGAQQAGSSEAPVVEVFKDPNCGCCSLWAAHLERAGFVVRTSDTSGLAAVKQAHGVPGALHACHTAVVDGYVIEGHVPASDVHRLLETRPDVAGLAVPGMPIGSPGMEMPGAGVEPYEVLAFDAAGQTTVFATYP